LHPWALIIELDFVSTISVMVAVSLLPRRGNCTKYFPHVGHLGLSPVLVAGTIKLESQDDEEIINVAQIIVRLRCYEAIGGQAQLSKQFDEKYLPGNLNVLWETVSNIWPPPDSSHTSPATIEATGG
jgi:hypothetical protein